MFVFNPESLKKAKLTTYIITINIILFSLNFISSDFLYLFSQINSLVLYDFQVWRLFTAMFFHLDTLHLLSNMFMLLIFGVFIELSYSKYNFIIIYLVSGLIGNIFSLFLLPPNTISLGASGAIFGLIGAGMITIISEKNIGILISGLIYLAYFLISSFVPGVNYYAHIYGLIGGFILGFLLRKTSIKVNHYVE